MKKLMMAIALITVSVSAQALVYEINGGNWTGQASWNTSAIGSISTNVYDNGEVGPPALLAGNPGIVNWTPALPASYNGTYSGLIVTNNAGVVTGGFLSVSGWIGSQFIVGPNSWWAHSYQDLLLNFETMTATTTGYACHDSFLAPASCGAGGALPASNVFSLTAGNEGIAGAARYAATFDGTTLSIFSEGYSAPGPGTDYLNTFDLVPIPAAAWLFASGLAGLGWFRNRQQGGSGAG